MEENELRIGNFVYNFMKQPIKVTWENIKWSRDVNPIPLTEEILLKCGFVENGDTMQFHLQGQIVSFNRLDGGNFWIMDTDKGIRCKYLHQLQNTWYTFKGKELEINL